MRKSIIVFQLLGIMLITWELHAQSADDKVRVYLDSVRTGMRPSPPQLDGIRLAEIIKPYLTDTAEVVRIRSRELLFAVASASPGLAVHSKAITRLLASTETNDVKMTGIIIPMIKTFQRSAFTDSAKMHVRGFLKVEGPYLREWMKIAAFLGLRDLESDIRPYSQPGNQQSMRWAALLSLARMGDERAAVEVLNRVKKLGVKDEVVYQVFPDLVFTRDDAAIDYMIDVLHQDGNHCLSADIERETAIPCGYRIMEQLAPIIEGFPLQLDESGDLDVEDYATALATARQWFTTHKKYSIQKERY